MENKVAIPRSSQRHYCSLPRPITHRLIFQPADAVSAFQKKAAELLADANTHRELSSNLALDDAEAVCVKALAFPRKPLFNGVYARSDLGSVSHLVPIMAAFRSTCRHSRIAGGTERSRLAR